MASEKITAILDEIKALTILEVADLVKALEEEFGVSAAPVAVAAVGIILCILEAFREFEMNKLAQTRVASSGAMSAEEELEDFLQ